MKNEAITKLGKYILKVGKLKICIIDDEESYFNDGMLKIAASAGFSSIERHYEVDQELFEDLQRNPREIVILDIKGIAPPEIAKDGLGIASVLFNSTPSYIVITSAHQFHLREMHKNYDWAIENRLLTAVDFVEELEKIVSDYLANKVKFYQKIVLKTGMAILRRGAMAGAS